MLLVISCTTETSNDSYLIPLAQMMNLSLTLVFEIALKYPYSLAEMMMMFLADGER